MVPIIYETITEFLFHKIKLILPFNSLIKRKFLYKRFSDAKSYLHSLLDKNMF